MIKIIFIVLFLFLTGSGQTEETQKNVPEARSNHSAIYDSANKQMIIFGGHRQSGNLLDMTATLNDTWIYDIEKKTWKEVELEEVPPGRGNHKAIYDSVNKQMVIFGGYNLNVLTDIWIYDIEKKQWKEIEIEKASPARLHHSAVYDPENKQMIIFGGSVPGGCASDTWIYNIGKKEWEEIEVEEAPPARFGHSAIYDLTNKQMIIFGGRSQMGPLSDTWVFDIGKKIWKEIETDGAPPARSHHSAVYDSVKKQMVMFGGIGSLSQSDTWIYDIEKKAWEEIEVEEAPPAVDSHSAVYDPENKQMIIFGGKTSGPLVDIWIFNIEKKTWEEIETEK